MPNPFPDPTPAPPMNSATDSDVDVLMGNSITGLLDAVTQQSTWNRQQASWEPPDETELKRLFPAYEIEALLGRGGMGVVYMAHDTVLRRTVAIKLLPPILAEDAQLMARFKREAQIMNSLDHPGIVKVDSFVQTPDGHAYFVMEYVAGKTIHELVQAKQITFRRTLRLIVQVCKALQYLHGKGILHRDIKPSNIIVDEAGNARLLDFGIAGQVEKGTENLTLTGHNPGTPFYMAPELHKGDPPTASSDIYALGVTFYEMLTGERPQFQAPPPSKRSKADPSVDKVVSRALKPQPEARYQNADQMRRDIQRCSRASREFRQGIVLATSIIVTAALAMVWLLRPKDTERSPVSPLVVETMVDPLPAPAPTQEKNSPSRQPLEAKAQPPPTPAPAPQGFIPYTTSFESPEFKLGALGIGDGLKTQSPPWSLFVNGAGADLPQLARVQNSVAKSGGQALLIQAEYTQSLHAGISARFENSPTILNVEADIHLASSPSQTAWQFGMGDPSVAGGWVGGINIGADNGRFQLLTPGYKETATIITRDTWYRLRLILDVNKQTYQVFVNDAVVATAVPFLAQAEKLRLFQFATHSTGESKGNDLAYLDNFSITEGSRTSPAASALQDFKSIVQGYEWTYVDSLYPPAKGESPGSLRFHSNGKFHDRWNWNYWVAAPGVVHVQFWDPVYKPENAITLKFNEAHTSYSGQFTDEKGRLHRLTGTRLDPIK